jgi:polyhydroxybutyrate depolymerase
MGWRHLIAGFVVAVALICGARAETITVDGLSRSFIVHRPATLSRSRPAPLVIMMHGGFGTGEQAEHTYGWDAQADRKGFVVVYPDGIRRSWNAGGACCGTGSRDNIDDVGFLTRLIATVSRTENIDGRRVYLTGISNGAAMAYRYACEGTLPIAAVGAVAGSFAYTCPKPHAVSVMEIHGAQDRNIPLAGGHGEKAVSGVDWLGVEKTLAPFRAAESCDGGATKLAGVVKTTTWRCAEGREVVLITVTDAGHQWPGATPQRGFFALLLRLDPPSTALDATDVLWNFFARHAAD